MAIKSKLDLVIVNWNAGEMLTQCVESIQKAQKKYLELGQVIIVDNGSADSSLAPVELLIDLSFKLNIIRNKENRGFAAACNQGAALSNSEYLLFLNPDTRLFENSLSIPLYFLQQPKNANVGIVGIQLIDEHNNIAHSCSRFPSLNIFIAQVLGLNRLHGYQHLTQIMVEWPHDRTQRVDQIMGAFFLMRRCVFIALDGFDERYFVYFEEVDLSLRAYQIGWQSVYLTKARAFHAGGGTSHQVKAHRLFYSLRSRLLYGFKHFKGWQAWILWLVTLILELITRSLYSLMQGGTSDLRNTLRAYGMLYRDLPSILRLARGKP